MPQRISHVPDLSREQGFTIIEILVGMMVGVVVIGAAFTTLTMTQKSLRANEQTVGTQQNVRVAMEMLSRDIKVAGFGSPAAAIGNCTQAIMPSDQNATGVDSGPDSVQLLVPVARLNGDNRWTLRAVTSAGGTNVVYLQEGGGGAVADMVTSGLVTGSYVSIGGAATVQVTSYNAGSNSLSVSIPPPLWFQIEDPVYLLQCIQYRIVQPPDAGNICLGGAPCLTRGVAGVTTGPNAEAPIAEGVEDLQLAYACDGCVATINSGIPDRIIDDQNGSNSFDQADFLSNVSWTTAPRTADKIQLVQIALVARQAMPDQGFGETSQAVVGSPAVVVSADRTLPADANHRRRLLVKTVETRNVGL